MPIEFRVNDGIGVFTTIGNIDYQEGMTILKEGLEKIELLDRVLILFDLRQSQENRSPDEIREIAKFIKLRISKKVKIALVATHDFYYGLSSVFAAYVDHVGIDAQVFKNINDALSWLKQ